jgi:hypothetical protein
MHSVSEHIPAGVEVVLGDMLPEGFEMSIDYAPRYDQFVYRIRSMLYAQGQLSGVAVAALGHSDDRIIDILMMEHKYMIKDLAGYLRQEADRLERSLQV